MRSNSVLIIHNIAWSHYKAIVFSELYNICKEKNIDMRVVHIAVNERGRKLLGEIDFSIHNYPFQILFNKFLEDTSVFERINSLIKKIRQFEPQIIVIPGWNDIAYWIVAIYSKFKGIKLILQVDSTEFDRKRIFYKELIKKLIVKLADAYWCYGTASKSYLIKLGAREKDIFIRCQSSGNKAMEEVYIKILKNKEKLIKENDFKSKNFIFVGRLSSEKNILVLIKAFKNVKKNQEAAEWGLIIVGDGPQKKELEETVKSLKIRDVYFLGGGNWKEIMEYYFLADVFILPSISEPWGIVVNEAMTCGLPVIVSKRAGAYWDLVKEGINGFGFDPYNQKELEEIMLKFIKGEVDIKAMGEASREIVKDYTPENAARQMFKSIKYLLEKI